MATAVLVGVLIMVFAGLSPFHEHMLVVFALIGVSWAVESLPFQFLDKLFAKKLKA